MHTDAARKTPKDSNARVGAKLQLLFFLGVIGSAGAFGYAVDGPRLSERWLVVLIVLQVVAGIAVLAGLIGLVLICVALVKDRYRAPWFFWLLVLYAPLLLLLLPIGTPFGIFFIIYPLMRRREFFQRDVSRFAPTV